ncbi:MAG: hypothetical protein AM326_04515 [Candidatus Thorarchaeota archaeon SMTZ-45]|nr:MAG: hypothetical protein AM326_04515 [Candidatus Thorarchaeota archaeon SMTZ-45]
MRPEKDAYGQLLWAHYQGKEVFETVERDDGYISAAPLPKAYFSDYEDWKGIEREAMEFVKGRVLDVGCGAGRHSIYLQKEGYDVLGIDNSPLAIKVCRLRGLLKAEVVAIEDMNFPPNSFDTIIMMGNNFGLLGSFEKAQNLLKQFYDITSSYSSIIAHTQDPYKTDKPAHLDYQRRNKEEGKMGGQLRIRIRFGKYVGRWFDYLMVSQEEMKQILKQTGWRVKRFIDSEDAAYVAIIEKRIAD